jgi:uncharacterized LabA/DUF88 family protein
MRTFVYVDGFNLYYAIRNTPYKWLDLKLLAEKVLPARCQVAKVKYYTARVSGAADPDQPRRQQIYLNALGTVDEIEVFFGNFLAKNVLRPLSNLPIANKQIHSDPRVALPEGNHAVELSSGPPPQIAMLPVGEPRRGRRGRSVVRPPQDALLAEVYWMEEKGSDVNLACHLVNDAWQDAFEVAAVISNDTDLCEPIRIVTQERGKHVVVVCPDHRGNLAAGLQAVASSVRHINRPALRAAQFADTIANTKITKPAQW